MQKRRTLGELESQLVTEFATEMQAQLAELARVTRATPQTLDDWDALLARVTDVLARRHPYPLRHAIIAKARDRMHAGFAERLFVPSQYV
jgi:hypothetical protein